MKDIILQRRDPLDLATSAPASAADPVLALRRVRVRLGYDRQAHLAWHDRTHPVEPVAVAHRVGPATSGQGGPVSASAIGDNPESSAEALVEALDGSERKLLLSHLARAYPEVVEAGFARLAEYHAAAADRQRASRRRREHDKRRRRRAEDDVSSRPAGTRARC